MNKNEKYRELAAGYFDGSLDELSRKQLDDYMRSGEMDPTHLKQLKRLFDDLGHLPQPEPPPRMRLHFQKILQKEISKQHPHPSGLDSSDYEKPASETSSEYARNNPSKHTSGILTTSWLLPLANRTLAHPLSRMAAIFLIGVLLGTMLAAPPEHREQVHQLATEVHHLREMIMITLLDHNRASERLRAVQIGMELPAPHGRIIEALLQTLNYDENINVRLAAIDALIHHAAHPEVRKGLVQSISIQKSPMVQVALADAMLAMRESSAAIEFEKLMNKQEDTMNLAVREKLYHTVLALR